MLVRTAVIISLMAVSAYLLLMFFGRLVKVDMFSAIIESNSRTLFLIILMISHIVSFLLLYVFFVLFPLRVFDMNKHHAGGLSGYMDQSAWDASVYDPVKGTYVKYPNIHAPSPAEKFTGIFEVVSFYKSPSDEYYQDTDSLGFVNNLIASILGFLFLVGIYFILYNTAKEYIASNVLHIKLSHAVIASRFRSITGLSPVMALIILLSITVIFFGWSVISAKTVRQHYRGLYASHQQTLRNAVLKKATPGETLTGHVIRRFYISVSDTTTEEKLRGTRTKTRYYHVPVYTVEFRDLIHIPVYLSLRYMENEERDELNRHFPDPKAVMPKYMKDYSFTVNPDYSISLMKNKRGDSEPVYAPPLRSRP